MNDKSIDQQIEDLEQLHEDLEQLDDRALEQRIEAEHDKRGWTPDVSLDSLKPMKKEVEAYDGMRFIIEVNDAKAGESITMHIVHGTWSRRENKRRLREYLNELGYTKRFEQNTLLKRLGFWNKGLGKLP